jgi:sulfur carrier protein
MELYLNGEARQFESALSISKLTQQLGLEHQRVAIEVNRCIIPKSLHATHMLAEGDRVEVIQAIGGG